MRDERGPVGRLVHERDNGRERAKRRRGEQQKGAKEKKEKERERTAEADSLVKVGGAWHAWRRKHKAWFERVSTLFPVRT